jgi:hypothetical protein
MEDVLYQYALPYNPLRPLICFDERPCFLIDDIGSILHMSPGKVKRYHYEYAKNGSCCVLLAFEPHTGFRYVEVRQRRTAVDYAEFMKTLFQKYYSQVEQIRLVQDNLNTHTPGSFYEVLDPEEAFELGRLNWRPTFDRFLDLVAHPRCLCGCCLVMLREGFLDLLVPIGEVDDIGSIGAIFARWNELDVALVSSAAKLFEVMRLRPHLAPLLGQGEDPIAEGLLLVYRDLQHLLGFLQRGDTAKRREAQRHAIGILDRAHPVLLGQPKERFDRVGADGQAHFIEAKLLGRLELMVEIAGKLLAHTDRSHGVQQGLARVQGVVGEAAGFEHFLACQKRHGIGSKLADQGATGGQLI